MLLEVFYTGISQCPQQTVPLRYNHTFLPSINCPFPRMCKAVSEDKDSLEVFSDSLPPS
jgi:hypothetical protein